MGDGQEMARLWAEKGKGGRIGVPTPSLPPDPPRQPSIATACDAPLQRASSSLLQPERGRARRRGMIRTLADTFRHDIRDQKVRIDRAAVDHIVQLRSFGPRVARIVDPFHARGVVPIHRAGICCQGEQQDAGVGVPAGGAAGRELDFLLDDILVSGLPGAVRMDDISQHRSAPRFAAQRRAIHRAAASRSLGPLSEGAARGRSAARRTRRLQIFT